MLDREGRYWDCVDQAGKASSGGRTEEALAWLDEALRLNPRGAEARNGRGEILWDQGRHGEALREFSRATAVAPHYYPAHLNRLELLTEEFGEYEDALDLADEILGHALEASVEGELFYLKSKALFYLDDLEGALFLLRRALQVGGEQSVYRGFEGQIYFELGRLGKARGALQRANQLDAESAHTLYHMALLAEHERDFDGADALFLQAECLNPELYTRPARIPHADFMKAAEDALHRLPVGIGRYVNDCTITIEELPDRALVEGESVSPQVLGLFIGTPTFRSTDASAGQRFSTDRLVLFKRNLEKVAGTHEELVEQVQITVKSELGLYLGLDEEEIERLGSA